MSSGDSSVTCFNCHAHCDTHVCTLASVRLVHIYAKDTPLVVELCKLSKSVQLRRPHPDGELIRYKKGKLTCACGTNLGNMQDNASVLPYGEGTEVRLACNFRTWVLAARFLHALSRHRRLVCCGSMFFPVLLGGQHMKLHQIK